VTGPSVTPKPRPGMTRNQWLTLGWAVLAVVFAAVLVICSITRVAQGTA
jgi:hypothetical protein